MHLSLIPVEDHGHSVHVKSFICNALQTRPEFHIKSVEVFNRNGASMEWNVEGSCRLVFREVEICTRIRLISTFATWRNHK